MKIKHSFTLPIWLTDPEAFWPRISVGLAILAGILVIICLRLYGENGRCQIEIQKLSELNDRQRKVIGEIGTTLAQVAAKLDKIAEEQKRPAQIVEVVRPEPPAHTLTADLNSDGIVDWADFNLFAEVWDQAGNFPADFDRDGKVSWKDFQILTGQWMKKETWYAEPENPALDTRQARGERAQTLPSPADLQ